MPINSSCSYQSSCNGQLYDPSINICCNGQQLHQKKYNERTQCCGTAVVYDSSSSICCATNNVVLPKGFSCIPCSNKYYDPLKQICCDNKIVLPRKYLSSSSCCGTIVFDMTYYQCCRPSNVLLPRGFTCASCGGQFYHPKYFICCGNKHLHRKPNSFFECCGNSTIYDRRYFRCCPGKPPELRRNKSCTAQTKPRCHNLQYNPSTHICCSNTNIHPKIFNESTECCNGNTIFDSRTHKCCYASKVTVPKSHSCIPCDRTYYDPSRYICCTKTLHLRGHGIYTTCCGEDLVYDTQQYRCCSSSKLVPISLPCPSLARCNGQVYNSQDYICCGKTNLYRKVNENRTKCCGYKAYDMTKQSCCRPDNVVVPLSTACFICARKLYNPNVFICCGNNYLYFRKYGVYTACCGTKSLYDLRLSKCCPDRTILPLRLACPSKSFCAGKEYDPQRYICCGGTRLHVRTHKQFTQCCGSMQIYHSLAHKCCPIINKVVVHSYTCIACNGKFYDPSKSICCNGKHLQTKDFGQNTKCCGNVIYDSKYHRCCSPGNQLVSHNFACITCGGFYYDPSISLCCGGTTLFRRVHGVYTYCCGLTKVYNKRTQQCCHGDTVAGNRAHCPPKLCGGKSYDSSKDICCEDKVLFNKKHGSFTECCGNKKVYHKAIKKCCNGSAVVPVHYSCQPCDTRYVFF